MSDITANIIVQPLDLNVTVEQSAITVTPEALGLQFYLGGIGVPGGNVNTVQYNAGGVLGGIPTATWNGTKLSLGSASNITISGGTANYALITDGTGNLSWGSTANANFANFANIANVAYSVSAANITGTIANANYAAYAGNITIAAQPNITSVGNLTSLVVTGTANLSGNLNFTGPRANLGTVSNVKITGGTNGYVLQTDGTGNLTWTNAPIANAGNGIPGGSNTQIQYNDAGLFGGTAGFTFNKTSGDVAIPGNLTLGGTITGSIANANYANFAGNVVNSTQSNITTVGTLTALTVGGTTTIQQAKEKVLVNATGANGTFNYDLLNQAIILQTGAATGNISLNFRGNSTTTLDNVMSTGQSMTCTFINQNAATPYFVSNVSIDGSLRTVLYYNSNPPTIGSVNGKDFYTYNIIKTAANTYTILGSAGSLG